MSLTVSFTELQLDGLNLQIAEAAVKSGFDTLNHTALLDLIWAVRRVAFGHGVAKPSNQRPPKHPDYPDRFRPCESQKDSYQKREKPSQKRRRAPETQNINKGTASDPVDLDKDIDSLKKEQNSPPWHKRRKISYGDLCYKPAPAPGDLAAIKHSVFPNSRIRAPSYRLKQPRKWQGRSTQRSSISTAAPRPHLPTLQSSLSPPPFIAGSYQAFAFGRSIEKTTIQEQQALPDLRHVKKSLGQNADAVVDCLDIMKDLFDTNSELRKDGVMDALIKLKDDMMTCRAGAAAAMEDVDEIVDFVHCRKKLQ